MFEQQCRDTGKDSTGQELDAGEFYSIYFRREVVDNQDVHREQECTDQYKQIPLSDGESIRDAQEIKSDQRHCNSRPDEFAAFFSKEYSNDRYDHDIAGSDEAGFSNGSIFDAELLEITCQTEADATGNTADDQVFAALLAGCCTM